MAKVTSFRLYDRERALIAQLAGTKRGATSRLVRRLLAEEAARKNITVLPSAEAQPRRAA